MSAAAAVPAAAGDGYHARMARVIVYYAHPGHKHSRLNRELVAAARAVEDITFVDLYAEYPRHDIDIEAEQERLVGYDVIVLQFPLFWYSTPSLLKEWIDLVLQHGFAYGEHGDACEGKSMMLAVTAADPESAYRHDGYQRYTLREFLRPLEQTARLCGMRFLPPYVLYESLRAVDDGLAEPHSRGYCLLLEALRDDRYDRAAARSMDTVSFDTLPIREA